MILVQQQAFCVLHRALFYASVLAVPPIRFILQHKTWIMHYNDIIGSIGVGLILLAYFMNSFSLMPKDGALFFILNIVGAGLACYASSLINYVPFIILEGVWCLVSVAGLIKLLSKK